MTQKQKDKMENFPKADPKNRLNDLDSRTWLQFQKSWFEPDGRTIADFVRFFTKSQYPDGRSGVVRFFDQKQAAEVAHEFTNDQRAISSTANEAPDLIDYVYADVRERLRPDLTESELNDLAGELLAMCDKLRESAYITVVAQNFRTEFGTETLAWRLAQKLSRKMKQKDEKIGCLAIENRKSGVSPKLWTPDETVVYYLHFRKEKPDEPMFDIPAPAIKAHDVPGAADLTNTNGFQESWYIHRPPRRGKNVLLHPAKFPEDLVSKYIENFTTPDDWVFDPMVGTGSSLVAAQESGRRACGIELNSTFAEIAESRFETKPEVQLVVGDAGARENYESLPEFFDYCITSPPYWDMLRMRGAETQAKRKKKGLPRWYSDDERDVGNLADYAEFLKMLTEIYRVVAERLRPGRYMTIIVKNVKKQGVIYPLAWDIVEQLRGFLIFCGEQFWCQDDQRLAPFGYRYAWVSNTFHHYCLTFMKPVESD